VKIFKWCNQKVAYDKRKNMQMVTAWVNMIGIPVKKTLLDSAIKSCFHKSIIEPIMEREDTFEKYISHGWVVGLVNNM